MSMNIYTNLYLSPKDYAKKKVRGLFDDGGWVFEYEGSDDKPDDEGMLRLTALQYDSYDDLIKLADMGIAFVAHEDSRMESEGSQSVFVAYRKSSVYIQEDGSGFPVVPVQKDGKILKPHLAGARAFWKLRAKVVAYCLKNAPDPTCVDCGQPITKGQESMNRGGKGLSHLEPCTKTEVLS